MHDQVAIAQDEEHLSYMLRELQKEYIKNSVEMNLMWKCQMKKKLKVQWNLSIYSVFKFNYIEVETLIWYGYVRRKDGPGGVK